jgi:hypothetical protein
MDDFTDILTEKANPAQSDVKCDPNYMGTPIYGSYQTADYQQHQAHREISINAHNSSSSNSAKPRVKC